MAVSNSTHISRLMQDQGFRQRVQVMVVGEGKYYQDFPWGEVWIITDQIVPLVAQEQRPPPAQQLDGLHLVVADLLSLPEAGNRRRQVFREKYPLHFGLLHLEIEPAAP